MLLKNKQCCCYNSILTHLLFNLILRWLRFEIKISETWMQNLKTSRPNWERVMLGQNNTVPNRHCSLSSSSGAANLPEKKGKKLWNAGIPVQLKHKLQILSSWKLLPQGDKDQTSGIQVPAKKPTPPSQPCLSRKESCMEGVPGTFPINTELSRGKRGGGES